MSNKSKKQLILCFRQQKKADKLFMTFSEHCDHTSQKTAG